MDSHFKDMNHWRLRSWYSRIFIMGISPLVRRYLYIETATGLKLIYCHARHSGNKDPRIDIVWISIQRESVRSMFHRCWFDGICYLGHITKAIWLISPLCRIYALMNRVNIGSDNGLSPDRSQAIIKTNAGLLSIRPLETNFIEIFIKRQKLFIHANVSENVMCEIAAILSKRRWVKL